jgi:membrane associated rhomboid family serine protease
VFPEKIPFLSMLTSMFLHGGVGHVLFNMWFLWIFGNNVEEAFGRLRYILMYIVGGVAATMAFVVANPDSTIPLVGASGAIAAVLGSYAVLFPGHRVLSLLGWFVVPVPAALFLGLWFVAQFGLGGTNVAWEAHAGGFAFGFALTLLFRRRLLRRVSLGR